MPLKTASFVEPQKWSMALGLRSSMPLKWLEAFKVLTMSGNICINSLIG